MMRLILVLIASLAPAMLQAACSGHDLAPTLTSAEETQRDALLAEWPYASGNHWRATRGDTVIHLVGTIHIDDPRLDPAITALAPIVSGADLLLLEMTARDREALSREMLTDPTLLFVDGPTLPERLPEDEWQMLAAAVTARGVPAFMASRMRPWYLSVVLSLPACLSAEEAAGGGVDARLETIAHENNVPTMALEDPRGLFSAFNDVPFETQMALVHGAIAAPDAGEDLFETLMVSYLREAHGEAWALSDILAQRYLGAHADGFANAFATMEEKLLNERNIAWMDVIIPAAENAENGIVAAFGAAHLGGPKGVLTLLEKAGFALERQSF